METEGERSGAEPGGAEREPGGAEREPGGAEREPGDPTAIREQPALTTSTGAIWLIVGGLFVAVSLAVLIPMATLPNGTAAVVAAIIVAALYLGMLIARFALPPGRRRLGALATGMLLIAAISLGAVLFVAAGAWSAGGAVG